jgi:hypothetical protein
MIFHQPEAPADFAGVEAVLLDVFHQSQEAARNGEPIVYVLKQRDLLGQDGVLGAMLAQALLSAVRTLAAEKNVANAIAVGEDAAHTDHWIAILHDQKDVSGELVRLGPGHVGKALT